MSLQIFLTVAILLPMTMGRVYYVTPDDYSFSINNENTNSLSYYLNNTSKYFTSDSQLNFKPGNHYLNTDLVIQNATNVKLTGENLSIIICTSHINIIILNVTNLTLNNINFKNCGDSYSNYLLKYHSTFIIQFNHSSNAAILLYHCTSVELDNITIIIAEGNTGMLAVNMRNYSKITNIKITVETNSPLLNISSLQTHGILFYFDDWHNPIKTPSEVQLDDYQFTINGSCLHPRYYAISLFLFQINSNVSVIIQNTKFTDLTNVTALHYHGKACGTQVSSKLTIRNCVVSNNTGSPSLNMFYLTLNNMQCIKFYKYLKSYNLQQNNYVKFTNCTFESNFNMSSMIYLSPISSRSVTCYLHVIASSFHDNRNVHFLIMRNDDDNIWQYSNNIRIKRINITSNVHNRGQNLMPFTNSMVWFHGPIKIMDNKYYVNILNFHLSICNFQNNIVNITSNTVRQLLSGTFIVLWTNTTVIITKNVIYILLNQIHTYSTNSEPICSVQLFSLHDIFTFSKFLTHVTMSNNIHMISKYLPNYDYRCRWLAGSAFQKSGLEPKFVFEKLMQIENNTIISENKIRPIPLSICKCVHPYPWFGTQHSDDDHDCYSSHLGSIIPGQTLKVVLVVKIQWAQFQNFSAINVVVHNADDDDCNVVDTFQLSQTHLNHGCNNYSYTLWPKYKNIKTCKLFIGLQNMPEMFYVHIKPCPLGFTLQEDKKSCYCDPLVINNKVIPIKSCNLDDETVLRPAYSWISATRNNITNTTTYIVSSYCPFQHCLPHQSYLKLSIPDSQCQYNRTGLLCGKCQQGLSTVFGTPQCKHCSNVYLLLTIPITIGSVVFVGLLYIFDITITHGTVNTSIFYINILDINILMVFPDCESFICVALSYMNLEFRTKSCFYNGMDNYAKGWLNLFVPMFLIIIATVLIILSRYSAMVQKLTAKKALPVLATLFLLSYTKMLVSVCNVLFRYSTIAHLPSNKTELVWSVSTTTPLFGLKFLAMFIVCLILFLILLPFNLILLFTRTLSCLKCVSTFKPILDPYFAPYKDGAYYWTGLLLLIRVIVYVLLAINEDTHLIISVLLGGLLYFHATMQPFKNKFHNIQECFTILNLSAIHAALSYKNNFIGLKIAKVLITIGMIYFILAIVLHCCVYRCNNMIHNVMEWLSSRIRKVKDIR